MASQPPSSGPQPKSSGSGRLDSWKEIAAYLKRDLRTVQRWEEREGLPVRRHFHARQGSVYAYTAELDVWWRNRKPQPEPEKASATRPLPSATYVSPRRASRKVVLSVATAVVIFLALGGGSALLWQRARRRESPPEQPPTLAVLPFEDLSSNPGNGFFAEGFTDDLITDLGRTGQFPVISRTSIMQFKGKEEPLPHIAQALHANVVVEGTITRVGDRVRITAQLIDATNDHHLWADSYESNYNDVLTLQDDIAGDIADAVSEKLTGISVSRVPTLPIDANARVAYLQGRWYLGRRDEAGLKHAIGYFNSAVAKEPSYAPAYAGLADAYALLSGWADFPPQESFEKSRIAASNALEIDPGNSQAHTALGLVKTYYDWNFPGAEKEFVRAIQINPANATAHQWYAYCLLLQGKHDDALREIYTAESLDPLSMIINTDVATILFSIGRDQDAAEQAKKTLQMDRNFAPAHETLGLVYLHSSRFSEGIDELKQAAKMSGNAPVAVSNLGYAYAVAHERTQALRMLAELQQMSAREHVNGERFALVYAGLDQNDEAVKWFRKAYSDHDRSEFCSAKVLPAFNELRADPTFQQLLHRIGFPQ